MNTHPIADIFPLMSESEFTFFLKDIEENGQREPIWTYQDKIIDGRNRYNACKELNREPITIEWGGEESELAKFVISLNLHRRHLNESQRAMVASKLADMKQGERADLVPIGTKLNQKQASGLLNVGERSVKRAKKVQKKGTPALNEAVSSGSVAVSTASLIADLADDEQNELVARGEKEILKASKQIRAKKADKNRQKRIEKIITEATEPLTNLTTSYAVIYADPPFEYEHAISNNREIENHYPTMDLESICTLPVEEITTKDAVLFMWAMSPKLEEALQVVKAWGFTYRTCAVWDKEVIGMGYYFRQQHEILMVATKGNIPAPEIQGRVGSVIRSRREAHSKKPDIFYEIIENMYPSLPRIELFARTNRDKWEVWGNQSNSS